MTRRRLLRWAVALGALATVAVVTAPYVRADQYGDRIRTALEQTLQRKVEIRGDVRFTLLNGPGFTLSQVVIHDAPQWGYEPLAYVSSLEARIGLDSLLGGGLRFSQLRLVEPSVNLARRDVLGWNVQSLLGRTVAAAQAGTQDMPTIVVSEGRINFKEGDRKLALHVKQADIELVAPARDGQPVRFRFAGQPARTDRTQSWLGFVTGTGEWRAGTGTQGRLAMEVAMEKSNIADLAGVAGGELLGLRGLVGSRMRLDGSLENLDIRGQLQLERFNRWEWLSRNTDGLPFVGQLNLLAQQIDLRTAAPDGQRQPIEMRVRGTSILQEPRWATSAVFHDVPLNTLLPVANALRAVPEGIAGMEGKLAGALVYTARGGLQGEVDVRDGRWQRAQAPVLSWSSARLLFANQQLSLRPAEVRLDERNVVLVQGELHTREGRRSVAVSGERVPVARVGRLLQTALGVGTDNALPEWLTAEQGTWSGSLRLLQTEQPPSGQPQTEQRVRWEGEGTLQDLPLTVAGLAVPVRLRSANYQWRDGVFQMQNLRLRMGSQEWAGEYRYVAAGPRPHVVRLTTAEGDLAEWEEWLAPTLQRRGGFLSRTLRRSDPVAPRWLTERGADVQLQVKHLRTPWAEVQDMRARLYWDGLRISVPTLTARMQEASLSGTLRADLRSAAPRYSGQARLNGLAFRGGRLEWDGTWAAQGSGRELLRSVRMEGAVQGQALVLSPDYTARSLTGRCQAGPSQRGIWLQCEPVTAQLNTAETYQGQIEGGEDSQVRLELNSGSKQIRIAGPLTGALPTAAAVTPVGVAR